MDPLSALSIAAAVVQFVDFAGTLVRSTYKIHKSFNKEDEGISDVNRITNELHAINAELAKSLAFKPRTKLDADIANLCRDCNRTAEELFTVLAKLRGQADTTAWGSFKIALKTFWSQDKIESLQSRLDDYRRQISMLILIALRDQVTANQEFQESQNRQIFLSLSETQDITRQVLRTVDRRGTFQLDIIDAIDETPLDLRHSKIKDDVFISQNLESGQLDEFCNYILSSLDFQEIDTREHKIATAHPATFDWILRGSDESNRGQTFTSWLKSSQPIYWITGKAGSGKSTLMKYIYQSPRLKDVLHHWCGNEHLRVLSFYFWNAGSDKQMSLQGLVRTLLCQGLKGDKSLIPKVFPNRLEAIMIYPIKAVFEKPLTWQELVQAFRYFVLASSAKEKLFILIDGLDEYGGKPSEVIQFIETLPAPRVKVCISSRPWVEFEDAFSQKPSLRLEELTRNDIRLFVQKKFDANRGFASRRELDPEYTAKLIDSIVEKASGVFLWVSLVVNSLLDGFSGGDRIADLQVRLEALPSDLEELFWKILSALSPQSLQRSSQFFQLLREAQMPLTVIEFSFADDNDTEAIINMPQAPLTSQALKARAEILRRRVNYCCKGLIEASNLTSTSAPWYTVDYLHRTVKDFWEKAENRDKLEKLTDTDFNPHTRLCWARIAMLKIYRSSGAVDEQFFWDVVDMAIEYAQLADPTAAHDQIRLLNELASTAQTRSLQKDHSGRTWLEQHSRGADPPAEYWTWTRINCRQCTNFLMLAAQYQLNEYVSVTLDTLGEPTLSETSTTLLFQVVREGDFVDFSRYMSYKVMGHNIHRRGYGRVKHGDRHRALVRLLLAKGGNPNALLDNDETAWQVYQRDWPKDLETAACFITRGAGPLSIWDDGWSNISQEEMAQLRLLHAETKKKMKTHERAARAEKLKGRLSRLWASK